MTTMDHLAEDAISILIESASPARCRSVVSRAYYAAFHACLAAATNAGYQHSPGAGGTHEQLFGFLKRRTEQPLKRAGERLRRLYRHRVDADYNLHVVIPKALADAALEDMTEIRGILGLSGP